MIGELPMQFFPFFTGNGNRLVKVIKRPPMLIYSIGHYMDYPLAPQLAPRNSFCSGSVSFADTHILSIPELICLPEVCDSVVRWVIVNVIHPLCRERTVHIEPSEAVSGVGESINRHGDMASLVCRSDHRTLGFLGTQRPEKTRLRTVMEAFFQSFLGEFVPIFHGIKKLGPATGSGNRYWPFWSYPQRTLA